MKKLPMSSKNIKEIILKGESETVEFKKSLSEWKEIIETVAAFSNTKGGVILVGIDDNGKVIGVEIGKGTIEELTNRILTNTEPKIYPEIVTMTVDDKEIIMVNIEKFPYDVVFAFGKPFKRVGKSTVRMSKDEYKKRIIELHKKDLYFDGLLLEEATIDEISENKLKAFIKNAKEIRNIDISLSEEVADILRKLKLLKNDSLTNASILLFGKNPQFYFPQASVKCIRFKGNDVTGEMIDFKEINSDLLS